MFLEACGTESKSAPAALRSIVAKPSKPSSIGKAQARHSSGAELDMVMKHLMRSTRKDLQ